MNRIVLAFESDQVQQKIRRALESEGLVVRAVLRSGADVLRIVRKMGGGVVICGFHLADMTANALLADLDESAFPLVLARPAELDLLDAPDVRTLATPFPKSELCALAAELIERDACRTQRVVGQRTDEEKALIRRAKEYISAQYGLSEAEAHHYLQRKSMILGKKITQTAQEILEKRFI